MQQRTYAMDYLPEYSLAPLSHNEIMRAAYSSNWAILGGMWQAAPPMIPACSISSFNRGVWLNDSTSARRIE